MKKRIISTSAVILSFMFFTFGAGAQSQQQAGTFESDRLIGKTVKGNQGEELGRIEDVFLDQQGQATYIILSSDDKKQYPVPISELKQGEQKDTFEVNLNKNDLEEAPQFAEGEKPDLNSQEWQMKIRSYYEQSLSQQQTSGTQQDQTQRGAQEGQPQVTVEREVKPEAQTESKDQPQVGMGDQGQQQITQNPREMIGKTVQGKEGEELGKISDILVDQQGQPQYVILSGESRQQFPVPMSELKQGEQQDIFQLDISKNDL